MILFEAPSGLVLRLYLWLSPCIAWIAPGLLRRRLARGKEDPARWVEKLGQPTQERPEGQIIWLHAVGLGEVLALRALIAALSRAAPEVSFLVTSSARSSAQVLADNLPRRTIHQYLPLDAPRYLARFLDHWRPALSVWAEQEIWPGAVVASQRRGIPVALVNARITVAGFDSRRRVRGLFSDVLERMGLIAAQDAASARHLMQLGARSVQVAGSLKAAAPVLAVDAAALAECRAALGGRRIWVAASTHAGDEAEAIAAQVRLWAQDPAWVLILVPRDPVRRGEIAAALDAAALPFVLRSQQVLPGPEHAVLLADSFGELGLWYRLAEAALIGGGFDAIGGHNPWEAAALGVAVFHGADVHNFAADYARLDGAGAAQVVAPGQLAGAIDGADIAAMTGRALAIVAQSAGAIDPLAAQLLGLMRGPR